MPFFMKKKIKAGNHSKTSPRLCINSLLQSLDPEPCQPGSKACFLFPLLPPLYFFQVSQ